VSRYGKNLPVQGRGKPIKARDLNAVRAVAEGLSRQQTGGVLAQTTIAGVPMSLAGAGIGVEILLGKSPVGGIAAGATETVTLYDYGTTNTLGATTVAALNPGPDACPAGKKVWIGRVNGVGNTILFWSCVDA
jgi:hypothetical protein